VADEESYVARQSWALHDAAAAAVVTGDEQPVWQIVSHLVAEGEMPRDLMTAAALRELARQADRHGTVEQAGQFRQQADRECSTEAMHLVDVCAVLAIAERRGWLTTDEYDRVAELAKGSAELTLWLEELKVRPNRSLQRPNGSR
jgi:hypothetical protein